MPSDPVITRIRELPDRPGIYIFKDEAGKALYVGKAKSLRKRAANYLGRDHEPRLEAMLAEAAELDFVATDTEAEALLLENTWIKRKKPRYNVLLRDDKTYPYLKLTADPFPRIAFTRKIRSDGADYFGPYLPGGLARKAIKLVQKLFQVRICHIPIDGSLPRPCLYHDMHRCLGPCVARLTTQEHYAAAVGQARLFLAGKTEQLVRQLRTEMLSAAEALEFERAAQLRDTLAEIELTSQRRKLSSVDGDDVDVYGFYAAAGHAALVVLVMRNGQVLDRRELFWEGVGPVSAESLLSEVLPQIYENTTFIPKDLHLPVAIEGEEVLADWLSEKKGERVYVRMPVRGPKAERMVLARHNAELAFRRRFRSTAAHAAASEGLARFLELADPPRRIEGFDISNFQGAEIVASLVVWEEGRMRKGDYRSFNIDLPGADDFASMHQAVLRRYRRRLEEVGEMPDLVLIDGGRGQLNAALAALAELGVEETPVVGLAKREEELYLPARPEPLKLRRDEPALQLLQQIRDEAHRFAVSKHRQRRDRSTLTSKLDQLEGIGPRRKRNLLSRFGSFKGVTEASLDELEEALGKVLGERIHAQLHPDVELESIPPADPVG